MCFSAVSSRRLRARSSSSRSLQDLVAPLQLRLRGAPLGQVVDGVDLVARREPLVHDLDGRYVPQPVSSNASPVSPVPDGCVEQHALDALPDKRVAAEHGTARRSGG